MDLGCSIFEDLAAEVRLGVGSLHHSLDCGDHIDTLAELSLRHPKDSHNLDTI